MAGRSRQQTATPQSPAETRRRVEKAIEEGRFQHALDLVKRLYADEKTPENRQLLIRVYMGRARQLRSEGRTKDAVVVLGNVPPLLDDGSSWRDQVAEELAACGQAAQALKVLEATPGSPVQSLIYSRAADAALEKGAAGRATLPESLHAGFDAVVRAFEQTQAGQDDAARETLQGIGLQSPFLEWRLLLRGLMAYYQNDDARALENWSRLSADRLPARLAAPLRMRMDPAYRSAQPPNTQAILQRQGDRLQGAGFLPLLRSIQTSLVGEDLRTAFKVAGDLLPQLQSQAPELVKRLASCFYGSILQVGYPEDTDRYRRVFGPPADDPHFYRLEALALERSEDPEAAHSLWQRYEGWVAANPAVWGADSDRVRALVWCHMGENAADMPDEALTDMLPEFLRNHPDRPKALKPPAEECFRKAIGLAPDLLEGHEALLAYTRYRLTPEQTDAAARKLLEHFPEHAPALQILGERCQELNQPAEALSFFARALKAHPLDRRFRGQVSLAHSRLARSHMEAGRHDAARPAYQAALAFHEGDIRFLIYTQWAVCEFLAKDTARAEELLAQALADAGQPLPVAFGAMAEAIRAKLPRNLKARFESEWGEALAAAPQAEAVVGALGVAGAYRACKIQYRGQKGHEKKLFDYLKRVPQTAFTEPLLQRLCTCLFAMQQYKELRTYTDLGRRRFPNNPHFLVQEVESYVAANPKKPAQPQRLLRLLDRAAELAEGLPADDARTQLLEVIDGHRKMLRAVGLLNSPGSMMRMFQQMMDEGIDEDDLDDDW